MRPESGTSLAAGLAALLFLAAARPLAAASWTGVAGRDAWPTFKGDNARTGRGVALEPPITVAWTDHLKGALYSSPAIQDGLVVLGSSAKLVYGLDLSDGAQRWRSVLPGRVWGSAPALDASRAYIGCVDGCVYALSLAEGSVQGVYCGSGDAPHPGAVIVDPMLVEGSRLIFGADDGKVYATDLEGHGSWVRATMGPLHDNGAAEEAGLVVIASRDKTVYGLGLADGRVRWAYHALGAFNTVPALDAERAYVGASDGRLYALSLADGGLVWSFAAGKGIMSSPALSADGALVFGSADGSVYCLSASTGAELWTFKTRGYVLGSPLITGRLVWVGSYDGTLYVLDLATGAEVWHLDIPGGVFTTPAEAQGRVLVAGRRGSLVCLQASRSRP